MEMEDNFTSAMYTRHIFLSEGASSFSSEDKNKLKCKETAKNEGKGIRQQNTVCYEIISLLKVSQSAGWLHFVRVTVTT